MRIRTYRSMARGCIADGHRWVQRHLPINRLRFECANCPGAECTCHRPTPVVVDAGTMLTVTIDQNIDTKTNNTGDKFEASLAEPVRVDGNEVLPAGTKVRGTVTQAASAGHLKGGAILALTLDSIRSGRTDLPD